MFEINDKVIDSTGTIFTVVRIHNEVCNYPIVCEDKDGIVSTFTVDGVYELGVNNSCYDIVHLDKTNEPIIRTHYILGKYKIIGNSCFTDAVISLNYFPEDGIIISPCGHMFSLSGGVLVNVAQQIEGCRFDGLPMDSYTKPWELGLILPKSPSQIQSDVKHELDITTIMHELKEYQNGLNLGEVDGC